MLGNVIIYHLMIDAHMARKIQEVRFDDAI